MGLHRSPNRLPARVVADMNPSNAAISGERVRRAAAAMTDASIERRQHMREESQRVWGHPGSVTSVRPLSFEDFARIALEADRDG